MLGSTAIRSMQTGEIIYVRNANARQQVRTTVQDVELADLGVTEEQLEAKMAATGVSRDLAGELLKDDAIRDKAIMSSQSTLQTAQATAAELASKAANANGVAATAAATASNLAGSISDGAAGAVASAVAGVQNIGNNLASSVTDGLGSLGIGGAEKPATLAQTTWSTGATDDLATADVYDEIPGGSPITEVKNFFSGIDFSTADLIRGGKFLAKNIPLIAGLARGGAAVFSREGLTNRILGSSSLITTAFRQLSNSNVGLTDGILKQVKDTGSIFASVDGVVRRVANADVTSLNGIGRLMNDFTGKNAPGASLFSLNDQDGQVGLVSGIINEATRYGIPNSFGGIVNNLTNTDIVRKVADKVLPSIVSSSDTLSLKSLAEKMGGTDTLHLNPNIIGDFANKYSIPYQSTINDQRSSFQDVMAAYDTIDTNWTKTQREGGEAFNLNSILGGSQDFIKVAVDGARAVGTGDQKLLTLASVLPKVDVQKDLMSRFPATVWKENQTVTAPVLDPIIMNETRYHQVGNEWYDQNDKNVATSVLDAFGTKR